ncbi:Insulin-degrading enzyme [Porphyridium purpureum]|uniref:Insulin-degrading enzyme n=1 Tax=Porphyridium purpureum TaxID=35688 RepID=A0A5J4YRA0_PORPP|nr:Insulin-degrading enzyme [Porphyridium purpureum]|eukprot:POR7103..scf229_5
MALIVVVEGRSRMVVARRPAWGARGLWRGLSRLLAAREACGTRAVRPGASFCAAATGAVKRTAYGQPLMAMEKDALRTVHANGSGAGEAYIERNGIQVSPLDTRLYRAVTLSNEMKVMLVSDPKSENAAASLDVFVGHFSDPDDIPGLAHFCEHMLFLGTEKYPDEGSYRQFLAEHAGFSNAYTSMENTNYHFQIVKSKFHEALDRFAQFFISPLFTESATEREMKAVDSEHQKNLQSDAHRLFQLRKSMASLSHPYHKFGTGSLATLGEMPAEKNISVRDALLAFHDEYYSANLMHLCIVAPEDLDTLEAKVRDLFSPVQNKHRAAPFHAYKDQSPYEPEQIGMWYMVVPVKDVHVLELMWIIDPYRHTYESKPAQIISHLVGHEGKGSLLSMLKGKGWADGLAAGPGMGTETFGTFEISIELTREGVQHVHEIIEDTFGYLELIRSQKIEEWVFAECHDIAAMAFRFQEREEPMSLATRIASEMKHFPVKHWLTGPSMYFHFDQEQVNAVLAKLIPSTVWIVLACADNAEQFVLDSVEPWYKTPYTVQKLQPAQIEHWTNARQDPALHFPLCNSFIPKSFQLLPLPASVPESPRDRHPVRVRDDEKWRVHYAQDTVFLRPKANIYFELSSPAAYQSPRSAVLTNLYTQLLNDDLNEFAYDADIAGLRYTLSNTMMGMRFMVRGYNDRLLVLLRAIVERIANYTVNKERFAFIVDGMKRDYQNFFKEQPFHHAIYAVSYCTESPRWHIRDYIDVCSSVSIEEVQEFRTVLFDRMYVEMLSHGNISIEDTLSITQFMDEKLHFKAMYEGEYPQRRIVQIPVGCQGSVFRQKGSNSEDKNSAIELYFQIPESNTRVDVLLELLAEMINKPCFHQLRTVEQLGYMVFSGISRVETSQGLRIIIQSTVKSPDKLDERIESFLTQFRESELETMSDENMKRYVDSLIAVKLEPEKRLTQQTNAWWAEIGDREYLYDRKFTEGDMLREVTKAELVQFFDDHIASGGKCRRKFRSEVYGKNHDIPHVESGSALPCGATLITDPIRFRTMCPLLPSLPFK